MTDTTTDSKRKAKIVSALKHALDARDTMAVNEALETIPHIKEDMKAGIVQLDIAISHLIELRDGI